MTATPLSASRRTQSEVTSRVIAVQRDIDAGMTGTVALKKHKVSSGRFYSGRAKMIAAGEWPFPAKGNTNGHQAPALFTRAAEVPAPAQEQEQEDAGAKTDRYGVVLVPTDFIGETLKRLDIGRDELAQALGFGARRLAYYLNKHRAPLWLKVACHGLIADQEIERMSRRKFVVTLIPQEHAVALANLAENLGGNVVHRER